MCHLCLYISFLILSNLFLFFFTASATTEIYTLSLHDALPISFSTIASRSSSSSSSIRRRDELTSSCRWRRDRKSTRLNSSHRTISYAVFCLKKKIKKLYKLTPVPLDLTISFHIHSRPARIPEC